MDPAAASEAPETDVDGSVTLVIRGQTTTVEHRRGDTVLATARRAGVTTPYSCEAGNCATCMALLREGSVTLRVNDALTDEELEEGWVLTCQADPTSESVTVDWDAY